MKEADEGLAPAGKWPSDELMPETTPEISDRRYIPDLTKDWWPILKNLVTIGA